MDQPSERPSSSKGYTPDRPLVPGRAAEPLDEVMDRYVRGDDGALDEMYRLAAPRVRAFLARLCADLALADDLTQDAFLRIHHARSSFVAGAPALHWMLAIARNAFRDHLRREGVARRFRSASSADEWSTVHDNSSDRTVIARQRLRAVQEALMKLPIRQREAFVLLRFEGLSLPDAAQVLGSTQAAAKILVHRAYVAVRAALEREDQRSASLPRTRAAAL